MVEILLDESRDYRYFTPAGSFLILYDHHAGRDYRYTVLIETDEDPVTIGRELDIYDVRRLLALYKKEMMEAMLTWDRSTPPPGTRQFTRWAVQRIEKAQGFNKVPRGTL